MLPADAESDSDESPSEADEKGSSSTQKRAKKELKKEGLLKVCLVVLVLLSALWDTNLSGRRNFLGSYPKKK